MFKSFTVFKSEMILVNEALGRSKAYGFHPHNRDANGELSKIPLSEMSEAMRERLIDEGWII